jgi:RNA polymerase sigma-70 factor (ECF subfamily)
MVRRAGGAESEESQAALGRLCGLYWPPIYGFLRRKGHSPADSQDLTQEFFAVLLRRNSIASANADRGRFRTFLLVSLQNFLRDDHDRSTAAKRGGGTAVVALDSEAAERRYLEAPSPELGPEQLFDRRWAMTLLENAVTRLTDEHTAAGKSALLSRLRPFLTAQPDAGDYEAAAADLGMKANTVAVTVRRLRQRCRELLQDELRATVDGPQEAEAEFRSLFG